mmetsp:Transcript_14101/g.34962  ORF Transcript_14101/g.34962 Transcript_14101/m.34962 type:complete len:238 (-) Transcript_14101:522-1235(-)
MLHLPSMLPTAYPVLSGKAATHLVCIFSAVSPVLTGCVFWPIWARSYTSSLRSAQPTTSTGYCRSMEYTRSGRSSDAAAVWLWPVQNLIVLSQLPLMTIFISSHQKMDFTGALCFPIICSWLFCRFRILIWLSQPPLKRMVPSLLKATQSTGPSIVYCSIGFAATCICAPTPCIFTSHTRIDRSQLPTARWLWQLHARQEIPSSGGLGTSTSPFGLSLLGAAPAPPNIFEMLRQAVY